MIIRDTNVARLYGNHPSWKYETQMWRGYTVATPLDNVSITNLCYNKELNFFIKYMFNYCYIHVALSFNIQQWRTYCLTINSYFVSFIVCSTCICNFKCWNCMLVVWLSSCLSLVCIVSRIVNYNNYHSHPVDVDTYSL